MCRFFFCLHSFRLAICAIHFGLRVATWLILDRDGKYRGWSEDRHPGEQRLCSKPRKPGPKVLFFRTRSRLFSLAPLRPWCGTAALGGVLFSPRTGEGACTTRFSRSPDYPGFFASVAAGWPFFVLFSACSSLPSVPLSNTEERA